MFDKILIANRGEIALRVLRACKELGIQTVAVHSTADADAMHVRLADESVCIARRPPRTATSTSGAADRVRDHRADAVHPGYGFLSEKRALCRNPRRATTTLHRAAPEHIRLMGDKIEAKRTAKRLAFRSCPAPTAASLGYGSCPVATEIGFPILVRLRPAGGGRGMKVAQSEAELSSALSSARAEAKAAFGDDAVYLEKYLAKPRHIEIQVLATARATRSISASAICSLQRATRRSGRKAPRLPSTPRARTRSVRQSRRRCAISAISASERWSSVRGRAVSISSR